MSSPSSKTSRSSAAGAPLARPGARRRGSAGFTLFELLISIAIFTVVTTLVLIKNQQFQGNILVTNLAYQVALALREAQVYGVSVTGICQTTGSCQASGNSFTTFSHGYGIHFDTTLSTSFWLFTDLNDNHIYDAGTDKVAEIFNTTVGYKLKDFCVSAVSGASTVLYCSDGAAGDDGQGHTGASSPLLATLDASFKRPAPSAYIYAAAVGGAGTYSGSSVTQATVTVISNSGIKKTVQVTPTGQISVLGE